jgi:copper chaperone CopZ
MYLYCLQIKGMTCGGCAASVQRKLEALPEIDVCEVNFATESARIGSQTTLHPKQLIDWIRTFGFSVQTANHVFRATEPQFDEQALQRLLESDPLVVAFQLNRELKSIDFTTLPDANTRELKDALEKLGLSKVTTSDQEAPMDIRTSRITARDPNDWHVAWIELASTHCTRVDTRHTNSIRVWTSFLQRCIGRTQAK